MWYLRQGVSGINEEMIISIYDHCEYEPQPSTHPIHYVAIIGASEVVRISASTNWPQKYFLRRVYAISLRMPGYCAYLLFRNKIQTLATESETAKMVTNLEFATKGTKSATKKEQIFAIKNVPKPRQILNLRQNSVWSNKIFSPLDHDTYICVLWILHSCPRSSFISFWIYVSYRGD